MRNLSDYFGEDSFNKNNYTNLNLSKIIYIIYKIRVFTYFPMCSTLFLEEEFKMEKFI